MNGNSFALAISLPLAAWASISTLSGLTQLSVHSVVAMQRDLQKWNIQGCNLTSLITLFDGADFNVPRMLNGSLSLPIGSSEEVGSPLISGLSQNFTNYLFAHEGMLCSGQYFPNLYATMDCLVGRAQCSSAPYTVNPADASINFSPLPDDSTNVPKPYLENKFNISQLQIVSTGNNTFPHPTNPTKMGYKLSSLYIKYVYTSKAGIPYKNLDVWKKNPTTGKYATIDSSNKTPSPVVRIFNAQNIPTDHWSGTCYQTIQKCNVTIENGKTSSISGCQDQAFNCWDKITNGVSTNNCQDKVAIGEIWRTDNVVSSMILNILRSSSARNYKDAVSLLESAISRLSLAWIASALPLELSSNLRFTVYNNIELAAWNPKDAVAIDLILICTLGVAFLSVLATYIIICIISMIGTFDPGYESRKVKWDAIEKYAALLCQRGEMQRVRPAVSESPTKKLASKFLKRQDSESKTTGSTNDTQSASKKWKLKKYDKVSADVPKIITTAADDDISPTSETSSTPSKNSFARAFIKSSPSLAPQPPPTTPEGTPAEANTEPLKPLWEVLFTDEGWDRICQMLGEKPRIAAPRRVYEISTELRADAVKVVRKSSNMPAMTPVRSPSMKASPNTTRIR
ncbi:hypothetical protein HDU97_002962 [Phlyctochytrium planicorne]|nr:hypothetical protein HDU97_002962 [Phlyctochytrium planicorne]